jgi:hypothetical protein
MNRTPLLCHTQKETEKKFLLNRDDHLSHIAVGPGLPWNGTPPQLPGMKYLRISSVTEAGAGSHRKAFARK